MKGYIYLIFLVVAVALFVPVPISGEGIPTISTVSPDFVKPGELVTATGEYLDPGHVQQFFLTDGKEDFQLALTSHTVKQVQFRVPAKLKNGRYNMMVLTTGDPPMLIEQPVRLTVGTVKTPS